MKTIEFMGMPKAGKTTQIELIETVLKHEQARVRTLYEGARVCPLDKKNRFYFNAWSFGNTINRLLEYKELGTADVLIDRGVYDHVAFTGALYRSSQITIDQCSAQSAYFERFTGLEDGVVLFLLDPEESLKREEKHNPLKGRVMNEMFLNHLRTSYASMIPTIEVPYCVIHGTDKIPEVKDKIMDFMSKL